MAVYSKSPYEEPPTDQFKEKINRFFVAGHAYGKPNTDNIGFHPPFQQYVNEQHDEFSMGFFTGDFLLHATEKNWDEVDSVTNNWDVEINYVAGNHDVGDRTLFRKRHAETNRTFVLENNLYVIWDLNSSGWLVNESHWTLIEGAIQKRGTSFNNIFIFTHQLFYFNNGPALGNTIPNSWDGKAPNLNFFESYLEKIASIDSDFYFFCGDVGALKNNCEPGGFIYNNLHIIYSGMGSGHADNFISVTLLNDSVTLSVNYLSPEMKIPLVDSFYNNLAP
ncbi:MAG: hypothetical protein JKY54_08470 [Flavobacteriales bacterium]|nr:hypothetical protein [Flavobacteriales bacterium]